MNKIPGQYGFATRAIHAGQQPDSQTGALATPVYQTSTFVFPSAEQGAALFAGEEPGYIYSRIGNPTQAALEEKMAALEEGEACLAFSSGMAAITGTLLSLLENGDHLLADETLYGCTYNLFSDFLPKFGIEVTFVNMADPLNVERNVKGNTKVVYFETPANPTLKLVNVKEVSCLAHRTGARVVVDNTFMSSYRESKIDLEINLNTCYIRTKKPRNQEN